MYRFARQLHIITNFHLTFSDAGCIMEAGRIARTYQNRNERYIWNTTTTKEALNKSGMQIAQTDFSRNPRSASACGKYAGKMRAEIYSVLP